MKRKSESMKLCFVILIGLAGAIIGALIFAGITVTIEEIYGVFALITGGLAGFGVGIGSQKLNYYKNVGFYITKKMKPQKR
jgi:hypothetical protein